MIREIELTLLGAPVPNGEIPAEELAALPSPCRRSPLGAPVTDSRRLVGKLSSYYNVLRDDGVGVIEYTEQLTYPPVLKMVHERATRKLNPHRSVPDEHSWRRLLDNDGADLEVQHTAIPAEFEAVAADLESAAGQEIS